MFICLKYESLNFSIEVIKKVLIENKKEMYEYKELPLESVEEDKEAKVRINYDVSDLIESIREIGQLAPGYAYKDEDKYKVFVGIRRLLAVKQLYEQEGKPTVFKAFVYEEKPKNFYELIRAENLNRSNLTGLDKLYIIMKYSFANMLLSSRDGRLIPSVRECMRDVPIQEVYELALVEQRAKAKGHENHFSLEELLFLFRDLHSLEERKLFALFVLVHRLPVKYIETVNFKQYAIANAPKLSDEELEIAGLSKDDVEEIIAIYKAPPYQADIIREEFEAKKEEARENVKVSEVESAKECETDERHAEEQPFANELPKEKVKEQPEEVKKRESEEAKEERIVTMDYDVEYENFNGERVVLIKKESGIRAIYIEDGQELEINGVKARIKYG